MIRLGSNYKYIYIGGVMKLYHGTTLENYQSIRANGFKPRLGACAWSCSDWDMIYVWDLTKVYVGEYNAAEDQIKAAENHTIGQAVENALIQAALHSTADNVIVLELDVPNDLVVDDDSGSNMNYASCVLADDLDWSSALSSMEFSLLKDLRRINVPEELMYPQWEEYPDL
jgi:hypothetical protein